MLKPANNKRNHSKKPSTSSILSFKSIKSTETTEKEIFNPSLLNELLLKELETSHCRELKNLENENKKLKKINNYLREQVNFHANSANYNLANLQTLTAENINLEETIKQLEVDKGLLLKEGTTSEVRITTHTTIITETHQEIETVDNPPKSNGETFFETGLEAVRESQQRVGNDIL